MCTKLVSNILDHTSMHDKDTKAKLVAKLIDKEGAAFARTVKEKSKVIQGTSQLSFSLSLLALLFQCH